MHQLLILMNLLTETVKIMHFLNIRTEHPELETFLAISGFCENDVNRLFRLSDAIQPYLPELTDRFYTQLQASETMRPYLNGRLDQLKQTHLTWLNSLFSGIYDDAFLSAQQSIGDAHVQAKVPPLFVSSSMSFLRAEVPAVLSDEIVQNLGETRADCTSSILKILDLAHFLIDGTYFERIMDIMGISRNLLNRLMTV